MPLLGDLGGDGAAREWIFTGGDYSAQRAREVQLLNDVLPDPAALRVRAHELAAAGRADEFAAALGTLYGVVPQAPATDDAAGSTLSA